MKARNFERSCSTCCSLHRQRCLIVFCATTLPLRAARMFYPFRSSFVFRLGGTNISFSKQPAKHATEAISVLNSKGWDTYFRVSRFSLFRPFGARQHPFDTPTAAHQNCQRDSLGHLAGHRRDNVGPNPFMSTCIKRSVQIRTQVIILSPPAWTANANVAGSGMRGQPPGAFGVTTTLAW